MIKEEDMLNEMKYGAVKEVRKPNKVKGTFITKFAQNKFLQSNKHFFVLDYI